ncbi:retinoid-binding protein 7-like [Engraulis encrasicolus]|uniref:retinoid-binding protein 7-like n=1 Tax=Engraulis encrasicolus TaxID=184585 RepID=UPI002FD5657F
MPDNNIFGSWDMISNVNFEGFMKALELSLAVRKAAAMLRQKKVIEQAGDTYTVKTLSVFRNYIVSFKLDEEFKEYTKGMDNRHCKSVVTWQGNKLVCTQVGEKKNRGWAQWVEDDKLHLELYCEGEVCKQVFKRIK